MKKLLKKLLRCFPDRIYLKFMYRRVFHKKLDLKNPKTFNEKLQWLKLYDRNPEHTILVDKYRVRDFIAERLGEDYLIPLLAVYDNVDEIDFNTLPDQFVIKCNHNSGTGMYICTDKSKMDVEVVKNELAKGLEEDYYMVSREWPYKNVKRNIIVEKYMEDDSGGLVDYKFFCFNGYVDCVMICVDRHLGDTKFYFFNKEWDLLPLNVRGKNAPKNFTLPKPKHLDKMFEVASELSKGLVFSRIDLYECNDKVYFGEITFFPDGGFDSNLLPDTDKYFGDLIDLGGIQSENCRISN